MPKSKVDTFSNNNKGRSYKKNKPDPEPSDSESDYETISEDDSYTSSSYVDSGSSYTSESVVDRRKKGKKQRTNKNRNDEDDDDDDDDDDADELDFKNIISQLLSPKKKKSSPKRKDKTSKSKSKTKSKSKPKSKPKPKYESSDEEEEEEDDDLDNEDEEEDDDDQEEEEDDDNEEEEEQEEASGKKDKNFKITLMIGPQANSGLKNRIPSNLSNEADCDTDDEEIYMKENFEAMDMPGMPLSPSNSNEHRASESNTDSQLVAKKKKPKDEKPDPLSEVVNIEEKYREIIELKRVLIDKLRVKPGNKIVQRAVKQCNHSIKKLIKHARSKNANTYEELLDNADNQVITDEIDYFKTKLSNKEQLRIMADLREINQHMYVEKPYRLSLLQSNMPPKFKAVALQRLHQLSLMEPGDPEYFKLKNWVDNFMRIPFGVHKNLSININDGLEKCSDFVVKAKEQLDKCVYGLEDAKMQIMQMVGQWIANPASIGTAIAIHGPPGSGKCFGKDTAIMMYDGSVKMVQNIAVGDVLMGDDSTPRNVLALGGGKDRLYKIVYNTGEYYIVNSEHILCLYNTQSKQYEEIEVRDLVPISDTDVFSKYLAYRTSVNFTENYFRKPGLGADVRIAGTRAERMELMAELLGPSNLKIVNKIGGIMTEYYQEPHFELAQILAYVARSLGYRTYINCVKPRDAELYRVIIHSKFENEADIERYTQESDTPTHVMEKFMIRAYKDVGDYYGFEIDGNKRFVLGDFSVTHNTSLVKDGISKILGREFAFIALGGCGDSSFLEGHSYTYEGSMWGKIAQIVMESKCMNPVIYFDELDKVSDTARGQEIIGVLTHLTDTSQNNQFHDKYFSEIELDLSKCLFIFSYNDENLVNPILRDRMYRIRTKGYDLKEKTIIARNYMLPKIREQVGFGPDDIVFSDDVLGHIISNLAKGEEGVRNLKRSLEVIHTKLNLYRLVKSGTQMFSKEMGLNVSFPYTLTKKDVDTLVKVDNAGSSALSMMYL